MTLCSNRLTQATMLSLGNMIHFFLLVFSILQQIPTVLIATMQFFIIWHDSRVRGKKIKEQELKFMYNQSD